ncbi:hypothetical protein FACS189421_11930 [Bacteroidia bacterium]|nr:hypothetical protein FACS189421_11930 [Bacteroidia bacterium]
MKTRLISIAAAAGLAGCCCTYNYYDGNVKYTQDGTDCIYTATQDQGTKSRGDRVTESKRIVYRDTICSQIASGIQTRPAPFAAPQQSSCGEASCAPRMTRKYYVMPVQY